MRVSLIGGFSKLFGRYPSEEDARLSWDTSIGAVAEPSFSVDVITEMVAFSALAAICVLFSFARRAVCLGVLCCASLRWMLGAIELRSLKAAGVALALCGFGMAIYFWPRAKDEK
jgi:hypothetical protein